MFTMHHSPNAGPPTLSVAMQWFAAILLSAGNFIAILNMTITNVAVPTIAGNLGISNTQGTWIITFYAVAEAITVPLTGWLSARFGAVKVFSSSMFLFGLGSIACGLSTSFLMLVLSRIVQGFGGGLLMPLSQTLLLRVLPKEKAAAATALWAVTTLVAPVVGPICGGIICDDYTWSWVFFLNAPIALVGAVVVGRLLAGYNSAPVRSPIDRGGLCLLIVWVGALQVMLDEGKDLDWFGSTEICVLAIIAISGFISFMIWELTEAHPVVDLRVFRHRGYSASVFTMIVSFGAIFGLNVLVPQWLQVNMGYTATWSGMTVAWMGVLAVVMAPAAAALLTRVDSRAVICFGVGWLGLMTLWMALANTDMTYWDVAFPFLFIGIGLPLYFVPVTGLAISSVDEKEMDSAAGLMNFLRTISGAFATSLTTTAWEYYTKYSRAELSVMPNLIGGAGTMQERGMPPELARNLIDRLVESQSVMLATNRVLFVLACVMIFSALTIWIAPKQSRIVDALSVH